jgi:hypothetical protein
MLTPSLRLLKIKKNLAVIQNLSYLCEHPCYRDHSDAYWVRCVCFWLVSVCDAPQGLQQLLEEFPSTKLVNDECVLG